MAAARVAAARASSGHKPRPALERAIVQSLEAAAEAIESVAAIEPDSPIEEAVDALARGVAGMTLEEACRRLASTTARAENAVRKEVGARLGLPIDDGGASCVRVMTLHGSKGLTFEVVFIPGLEQGLLPSERDMPFSGLVQQAARRMIQGSNEGRQPTPFVGSLSGRFKSRDSGLDTDAVAAVMTARTARLLD